MAEGNPFSVIDPGSSSRSTESSDSSNTVNPSPPKVPTTHGILVDGILEARTFIKNKAKAGTFWTKWFWYLLLGVMGLLIIVALVLTTYFRSQKLAKVLHERDVLEEQAHQAAVEAKATKHEEAKEALVIEAAKHEVKAGKLAETIVLEGKKNLADKDKIDGLESWADIKNKVKFNKPD